MITSVVGRGLIFSGDTPLACDIVTEQTGPMQITVRAGSFTTTGQARIRPYVPNVHDPMIAAGRGERLTDGRVRGWITKSGVPVDKAKTYTLAVDTIVTLTSDPVRPVAYNVDLIGQGVNADVFVKRKVGIEQYGSPPPGWKKVHELVFEFVIPPGSVDITVTEVYTLVVIPGFPEGTSSDDWTTQTA